MWRFVSVRRAQFLTVTPGTTGAQQTPVSQGTTERNRAVRILAKSLYRDLRTQGFDERQIVSLATELISEVTQRMASDSARELAAT